MTRLDLTNNQITSIESRAFTGLDSLTRLELGSNQITSLPSGAFADLSNLTNLELSKNQITSIESGDFTGLNNLMDLGLSENQITSIESGDFTGLGSITRLDLNSNQITRIESGDFAGLENVTYLNLSCNPIVSIESDAFTGLGKLKSLSLRGTQITSVESGDFAGLGTLMGLDLGYSSITRIGSGVFTELSSLGTLNLDGNTGLTNLNLEGANFASLHNFDVTDDAQVARVSLRDAVLTQTALTAIVDGGYWYYIGIGELPGITELDLSGVDFAAITDLSPLYLMDSLTDLWLADAKNLDTNALDVMLDNMATMDDPNIEGVLYLTQADYNAWNAAGGGKLARWDAELGHHVQIVPEPGVLALLAGAVIAMGLCRFRRPGFPA